MTLREDTYPVEWTGRQAAVTLPGLARVVPHRQGPWSLPAGAHTRLT
jgi:hypothetical protein